MENRSQLEWLQDVPVDVEAVIAGPTMRASEVIGLRVGAVIVAPRAAGESVDILAGNSRIGAGELSSRDRKSVVRMVRFGGGR